MIFSFFVLVFSVIFNHLSLVFNFVFQLFFKFNNKKPFKKIPIKNLNNNCEKAQVSSKLVHAHRQILRRRICVELLFFLFLIFYYWYFLIIDNFLLVFFYWFLFQYFIT